MALKAPKRKADMKVVILGAADVGKTTLIHRYIEGKFQESIQTIGASFSLKQWGAYNIALWDTAGEERFTGLSSFYCRGAGAAILAFDISDEDSFYALRSRFVPLLKAADEHCIQVVVGTKCDLISERGGRKVSQEELLVFARDINSEKLEQVPYFETSSVTGQNVDRVFEFIYKHKFPLAGDQNNATEIPSTVDLTKEKNTVTGKKGCC